MKYFKIFFTLIISVLVFFASCGDKNKRPVSVGLSIKTSGLTTGAAGQAGYLEFTTGHLFINEFSVDADRAKGDNVQFTRSVNSQVIVNSSSPVFTDQFDLVQGEYQAMNISIKISNNGNSNGLYLFGNYTDQSLITFQVQLKIDALQILGKTVSKNGSPNFDLIYDQSQYIDYTLDMSSLFSVISTSDWQSAQHVGGNPNAPVFIDDSNNQQLFTLILAQLPQCISVNFR